MKCKYFYIYVVFLNKYEMRKYMLFFNDSDIIKYINIVLVMYGLGKYWDICMDWLVWLVSVLLLVYK